MIRICRAPGCAGQTTSRFSIYCSSHKSRLRRHGAVDQEAITKADLKPYLRVVRARIEKNRDSPLWAQLDARWGALVEHAKGLAAYRGAMPRYERVAAQELIKLADRVEAREVVETTLTMFVMQELDPRRFRSDRAFRTQLVRRVRGLSEVNAGVWYDHATGRTKRAYRDLTPRATAVLGLWLAEAFGGAGLYLARLEQTEADRKQSERRALHEAFTHIT